MSPVGSAEFYGALTDTVPVAYVAYSMDSDPEALAKATSPAATVALLSQTKMLVQRCGGGGTAVMLPGSVPNLSAATESGPANRSQYISSAIVFATKGPYLLEVRWFNSSLIQVSTTDAPPLPTPAVMGSVVDAALARLPG
jgi:hypothetical protein